MTVFYRLEEGPPDLRREMTLAGFDMAGIDHDCAEVGATLEVYVEALATRPGGVCDQTGRESMSAAEIADTMRLVREWGDMKRFFKLLERAEQR